MWAEAVRRAGGVERMAVIEALEGGLALDGPSGRIAIDPRDPSRRAESVYLGEIRSGAFEVFQNYPAQPPADTAAVCDLERTPDDTTMYEIDLDV